VSSYPCEVESCGSLERLRMGLASYKSTEGMDMQLNSYLIQPPMSGTSKFRDRQLAPSQIFATGNGPL
jgi:hypothetical protein